MASSITPSLLLLLLHHFVILLLLPPPALPTNFSFPSFPTSNTGLNLTGDASVYKDNVLYLTNNAMSESRQGSCGRATYQSPVHLWDRQTMALADFTTTFSFATVGNKSADGVADGLAFFMSSVGAEFGDMKSGGAYFCLFSDPRINIGSLLEPIVAVEIDTYGGNVFDPQGAEGDNNHIGIDVHSILSKNYTVWPQNANRSVDGKVQVSYNATTTFLSAFLHLKSQVDPLNVSGVIDLRESLSEWVNVGFSAASGLWVEGHEIHSWDFRSNLEAKLSMAGKVDNGAGNSTTMPAPGNSNKNVLIVVALSILAVIAGALSLILLILWRRNRTRKDHQQHGKGPIEMAIDEEIENEGGPKRFSYGELFNAANGFSEDGVLGRGGFGSVHKGYLEGLNIPVAVKKLSKGSQQGIKEYISEVRAICRLRHKNLVKLIGWCHESGECLLVYQFMPNNSLDFHLFNSTNPPISWPSRLKIAKGLSSALFYLHEGGEECILHRDIKSSNVMLDSDFNAKLGDFGLARVVQYNQVQDGYQSSILAGSSGYVAPERYFSFKATKESDIYSFGVVLLEITCGRRPIEPQAMGMVAMVEWVWNLHGEGMVIEAADERLNGEFDEGEMVRLMVTGLWCAHPDYNLRPSIEQVVSILNYGAPLPTLPPKVQMPPYLIHNLSCAGSTTASGSTASNNSRSN